MTAGQFLDRAINAALIKAAEVVDRIVATSIPMSATPTPMADALAQAEEAVEAWEPPAVPDWPSLAEWEQELRDAFLNHPNSCDVSTTPLPRHGVEEVAPPSGAGAAASAGHAAAGAGGHPQTPGARAATTDTNRERRDTSELLYMAADVIGPQIKSMPEVALVFELRERAADFADSGD